MNWMRLSLMVLLVPTVVVGGAWLWLVNADLTFLKPTIENYVEELVSREFVIRGAFELEFGERITLIAGDVSLGNSKWSDTPEMVHIGHLRVDVDL